MISLLFMLACDGGSPPEEAPPSPPPAPEQPPEPERPPEPEQPVGAVTVDHGALLSAGACREDGQIERVSTSQLPDGRTILEVLCFMAAYQGAFEYRWQDGLAPVLAEDGQPIAPVGLPTLDVSTGRLTWLSKARGLGDCGDYFVYQLRGERFALLEHRSRPCDNPDDYTPPEQWALVGSAGTGHCTGAETAYFSCPTSPTKVLSLCGGAGQVQYRFGPVGTPELVFPEDSSPSAFTVREERYARSMADVATFTNGDVRYEVTDAIGGGGGPDAEANNFQGVYVFRGDELLASVNCTSEPIRNWAALRSVVPEAP